MRSEVERSIPAIGPGRRLTVVIPARNESRYLGAALGALSRQTDLGGQPLAREIFDVVVFANNCQDETAALARQFAAERHLPIHVVEGDVPGPHAHIGTARKYVMDLAAARFEAAGMPDGIVASTDADTIVDDDWIAATLREAGGVDAVAGHVTLAPAEQQRLLAPVRLLYARELTYRRLIAEVEALIDPVPEDPLPRHSSFVGASFAVRARTYVAAGALPPLPRLEDLNFRHALRRIDATIRHSTLVRATTSARVRARVEGGFGSFIAGLQTCAGRGQGFLVEDPRVTIEAFTLRAALRRIWRTGGTDTSATLGAPLDGMLAECLQLLAQSDTFGGFHDRVLARRTMAAPREVRVERAIEELRAAAHQHFASAGAADCASSSA